MEKIVLCRDDVSSLTKRFLDDESERGGEGWNKTKWEAEWLESFSRDVDMVRRTREPTMTEEKKAVAMAPSKLQNEKRVKCISDDGPRVPQRHAASYASAAKPTFDPLHLPSLIAFSVSLLGPLKARLGESMRETWLVLNETKVRVALLGGFCLGVGVCLFTGRW